MGRWSWSFVLVLCTGLLVASMPAGAATRLSFDDPAGDALDTRPSMDIVRVAYDVRWVDRRQSLVVELTLAAAPEPRLATYHMESKAGEACFVDVGYRPGTLVTGMIGIAPAQFHMGCDGDTYFTEAHTVIAGNVITLSVPLVSLPKGVRDLGSLSRLYAFTHTTEPVIGYFGNGYSDFVGNTPIPTDSATTDKSFNFA